MMNIRERVKRYPDVPQDEWRRYIRRQFRLLMGAIISAWVAAGLFTVWLLRGQ